MDGSSIDWNAFNKTGTSTTSQNPSDNSDYYQSQIQQYDEAYKKAAERFRKNRPTQAQSEQQNQEQSPQQQQSQQQPQQQQQDQQEPPQKSQDNTPSEPSEQEAAKPEATPSGNTDSQEQQPQQQSAPPQQAQPPAAPAQPELQGPPTPSYPEGFSIENLMPGGELPPNVSPQSLVDALRIYSQSHPDKAAQAARTLLFNLMQQRHKLAEVIDPAVQPDEATMAYLQGLQRAGVIDGVDRMSRASDFIKALSGALGTNPSDIYHEQFHETRTPSGQGSTLSSRTFYPTRVPTFATWTTSPEESQGSPQYFRTVTGTELDKLLPDIANAAKQIQEGQYWASLVRSGMESPAVELARRWMELAQRAGIRPELGQVQPLPMPLPDNRLQPIEPISVPPLPYQQ